MTLVANNKIDKAEKQKNLIFGINPIFLGIILFIVVRLLIWAQFDFPALFYTGDDGYYIAVAKNLINLGIHSDSPQGYSSYRAPAYPFFLATLLRLNIEINSLNIYIFHSVILFTTYLVSYFIIKDASPKSSRIFFLLLCLSPFDAIYNGRALAENLLSPLVLLSFVLLLFFHKKRLYGYVLPGIILGLLTLTKDTYLLLPFFIAIFMVFKKTNIKFIALFLIAYSCVIAPWMVRNATLPSENFIGISQGIFWTNLWAGTWLRDDTSLSSALSTGFIEQDQFELFAEKIKPINRHNEQDFFREHAINNLVNKPLQVLDNWLYRIPKMWIGTRTDLFQMRFEKRSFSWYVSKIFFFGTNFAIISLFLVVLVIGIIRKERAAYLSLIFIFYILLIYMPFYNLETRYSQPALSVMLLYLALSGVFYKDIFINTKIWLNGKRK